jgi:hypothetical protein
MVNRPQSAGGEQRHDVLDHEAALVAAVGQGVHQGLRGLPGEVVVEQPRGRGAPGG